MDFKLTINDDSYILPKYYDVENTIKAALAYWNNFGDRTPLKIKVEKIPNDTETLGIHVTEDLELAEHFGG